MKKLLLLFVAFATISLTAQVTVFEDDFDGSGLGFDAWTTIDVDGQVPHENEFSQAVNTQGWALLNFIDQVEPNITVDGFDQLNISGNVIGSHSWYAPIGQSDDWAISPAIDLTNASGLIELKWDAVSIAGNPSFSEDYVVKISNTGDAMADFTTDLLDVSLESNATPTTHTVDLSAYAGDIVYLAFNNDSNDRYGVVIDNIKVEAEVSASVDDSILSSSVSVYPTTVDQEFTVNNRSAIALNTASIYDVNGRLIAQHDLNNLIGEKMISVTNLSSGMYFVELNSDNGKTVKKLIKK
ncbi:MAG: choice-of-anchor J domain-containing protein [Flavobacteriaceae bacterium]|nr:choice-of-anchor J domain-containing protein [Flavobacteriaceae bacterium]